MGAFAALLGYLVLLAIWKAADTAKEEETNKKIREACKNTNLTREAELLHKYRTTMKREDGTRIPMNFTQIEFDHLVDLQLRKEGYRLSYRYYDMSDERFDKDGRLISDKPKYRFDPDWYLNLNGKYK